jgi:hypothetical protein
VAPGPDSAAAAGHPRRMGTWDRSPLVRTAAARTENGLRVFGLPDRRVESIRRTHLDVVPRLTAWHWQYLNRPAGVTTYRAASPRRASAATSPGPRRRKMGLHLPVGPASRSARFLPRPGANCVETGPIGRSPALSPEMGRTRGLQARRRPPRAVRRRSFRHDRTVRSRCGANGAVTLTTTASV